MKRTYETPNFVAERYEFSASIAACDLHVGTSPVLKIDSTVGLCAKDGKHGSHYYEPSDDKGGSLAYKYALPDADGKSIITLFNDGIGGQCEFDWGGTPDIVYSPNGTPLKSFSETFHSNDGTGSSGSGEHRPGYDGGAFES